MEILIELNWKAWGDGDGQMREDEKKWVECEHLLIVLENVSNDVVWKQGQHANKLKHKSS